ncbi:MAG TPA: tetratricopeptide repeat protein [Kineosporiaceae bacterium]|nr:tetratricopeptide repeat protein [Kineosporiaceae bacterium]
MTASARLQASDDVTAGAAGARTTERVTLQILGPLGAEVGGRGVPLGGKRQQAVLARILLADGGIVTTGEILLDVWGEPVAASAPASLHAYVSRLRRLLGTAAIVRDGGGYLLDRSVVEVDAHEFTREVSAGQQALARGEDDEAVALLGAALGRWRGSKALAGLQDVTFLAPYTAGLEDLHLVAAEMLADAHTRQGRPDQDLVLLEELARLHPLRESLAVRLVRALYAAGRQADALAAFERCRRDLADELGVDPSPPLRDIHAAVLAHRAPISAAVRTQVAPQRLPPRNRSFVGREALMVELGQLLDQPGRTPIALYGLGGVGKTELALELAHRRRLDGRVAWWITAEDPAGTASGLAELASTVGLAAVRREEDLRAALWSELDRNPGWVLVFDNADDPEQLQRFLPDAHHGDVLITSRNPAWRELARPVAVAPLDRLESISYVLLRSGSDDAAAAGRLAATLGDLPLALDQACAYVEQTRMSLRDYLRLYEQRKETLLARRRSPGERPTVATTWQLAFDRVARRSPLAATILETIAFLAPDHIDVELLRPLCEDELELQDALAELLRLSLIERNGDRLRLHRLVQDVVRVKLTPTAQRERVHTASGLCIATLRGEFPEDCATTAPHLAVVAAHALALAIVPDRLIESLATVARWYLSRALYPGAQEALQMALRLCRTIADPVLEGILLCELGEVLDTSGDLTEAYRYQQQAVDRLEPLLGPDDPRLAHAYNRLGHVLNCADDPTRAIVAHQRAVRMLRAAGREDLLAPVLVDLGYAEWGRGHLQEAAEALTAGRRLLETGGDRNGRSWAHATAGLGLVAQDSGRLEQALRLQRAALDAFSAVCGPDHPATAQVWDMLGYLLRLMGRYDEAVDAQLRAVRLLERVLGTRDSRVAMAVTNLGLAYESAGATAEAVTAQSRAHELFRRVLGDQHRSTLIAARRLAVALARTGGQTRARQLMDAVLDDAAGRPDLDGAEYGRIAADAAAVFSASGDVPSARHWQDLARTHLIDALGSDHPEVTRLLDIAVG